MIKNSKKIKEGDRCSENEPEENNAVQQLQGARHVAKVLRVDETGRGQAGAYVDTQEPHLHGNLLLLDFEEFAVEVVVLAELGQAERLVRAVLPEIRRKNRWLQTCRENGQKNQSFTGNNVFKSINQTNENRCIDRSGRKGNG